MTLIAEQPSLLTAMLVALAVAMAYGWLQTGKKGLIVAAVLLACLVPLVWWLADRLVTDRERIAEIIHEVAAAIEANDHEAAVKYIDDEPSKRTALSQLPRFTFSMAKVNSMRSLEITDNVIPVTARAELSVKVDVSERSGSIQDVRVLRVVMLSLAKTGKNSDGEPDWVITGYSHAPITGGPDSYSTDTLK